MLTLKYILKSLRVSRDRFPGDNERVPDELFNRESTSNQKRLSDYTIRNKQGLPTLDFGALEKLSDRDLRNIYMGENRIFIQEHIKQKGSEPICESCSEDIKKPAGLIRISGTSLCPDCFKSIYDSNKNYFSEQEQKYFNRLIAVFDDFLGMM